MKKIIVAAVAAASLATPALALDKLTFHAEAHGGWDRISSGGGKDDGVAYGAALGVDIPLGSKLFAGIEASADDSSVKDCVSNLFFAGDRTCIGSGRDLSAVARFGTQLNDKFKLYVLGGYANGRIKASYTGAGTSASFGTNEDGVRLGAGAEVPLGTKLYSKVEYRYTNYESDFSRHQVLVGFGVKF